MEIKDINKYVFDKKIPISFIWKNKNYSIRFYDDEGYSCTTLFTNCGDKFPNWKRYYNGTHSLIVIYNDCEIRQADSNQIFLTERETFEQCLSEFLYWFELNKHRCKNIEYYLEN